MKTKSYFRKTAGYAVFFLTVFLLFSSCKPQTDVVPTKAEEGPVGTDAGKAEGETGPTGTDAGKAEEDSAETVAGTAKGEAGSGRMDADTDKVGDGSDEAEVTLAGEKTASGQDDTAPAPSVIRYDTIPLLDSPASDPDAQFEIFFLEGVPDGVKDLVEKRVGLVPDVILDHLAQNGFRYIVDPSGIHSFSHAGTCTYPNCFVDRQFLALPENLNPPFGEIAINGSSIKKAEMASIHEIGHAVDFMLGYAGRTYTVFQDNTYLSLEGDPEWKDIFEEEAALSGFPEYNRTVPLEYFAEVFRYVFEDPGKLKNVPRSEAYVKNKLSEFYGLTFD